MSCQSSIYLHGVDGTHLECLVNRLFISMVSRLPCRSSDYFHGVNGIHLECLVNRLIISMLSTVLIGSVLSIVYLYPLCHGNLLGVPCQSSIYLLFVTGTHRLDCQSCVYLFDVMCTHWRCLVNRLLSP